MKMAPFFHSGFSGLADSSGFIFWFFVFAFRIIPDAMSQPSPIHNNYRLWMAEWYYSTKDLAELDYIAFQNNQVCFMTEDLAFIEVLVDEPDDPSIPVVYESGLDHDLWSPFIDEFNFWNELQMEANELYAEYYKVLDNDPHYDYVKYPWIVWGGILFTIYFSHTLYYTIMGLMMGMPFLWGVPRLYPPVNKYGRKIIITWMVSWRERIRFNDRPAYNEVYPEVFYRVPHLFRRHSSESEPEEIRNLLDPDMELIEEDDEMVDLLTTSLSDMDLDAEMWVVVPQIDGGQRYEKTRLEKKEETVTYMNLMTELDPKRKLKEEVFLAKMEEDAKIEMARLQAEAKAFAEAERRRIRLGIRRKESLERGLVGTTGDSDSDTLESLPEDADPMTRFLYLRDNYKKVRARLIEAGSKKVYNLYAPKRELTWREK